MGSEQPDHEFKYDVYRTPQQAEFLYSQYRYPAYFGGFANGKTFILCLRAWLHSLNYANNSGVLVRRLVKELRDTTRNEFFAIVGCNESDIAAHPWVSRWSGEENLLRLTNGSEIRFRHVMDDPALNALKSMTVRWFGIDQAEEVPEAAFDMLISRIGRTDIDPKTGKTLPPAWGGVVGNPSGHNWIWHIWKRFADASGVSGTRYHLQEATSYEGPYISAEYLEGLKEKYSKRWYDRYVLGSWDAIGGRVYDEFDDRIHVIKPFAMPDEWKSGIGVDLGWNHPTAFIWCAVDFHGNWYFYDEHVASEMLPDAHTDIVKAKGLFRLNGEQLPVYGPHDARNISGTAGINFQQAYYDAGLNMQVGTRLKATVGIQRLKQMLRIRPDVVHPFTGELGAPRCYVFEGCEKIRDEFALYQWQDLRPSDEGKKANPDEVLKVNDDAMDGIRSWVMGMTSRITPERVRDRSIEELDMDAIVFSDLLNRKYV